MKKFVTILLILVLVFSLTTVAFARNYIISPEKENTDVNPDNPTPSPQTGENGTIFWVIAALILAVGTVVFCGKKLVLEK